MSRFGFRDTQGADVTPPQWLHMWADRYPIDDYAEHDELIARHKSYSATDFVQIGQWKDGAKTEGRWRANVASVAYQVWMQTASELPECPEEGGVAEFLEDWSNRAYTDVYKNKAPVTKRFGLSRATTLLHFVSGGTFPIFDARVRKAMRRLLDAPVSNTVRWYLDSYRPLFSEIATLCETENLRTVDLALFSYGGRGLPLLDRWS